MILTEHTVTQAILQTGNRFVRHVCLPRFTPARWFEMDVCEITDAGLMREYEVKLTRADFRADARKTGPGKWHFDEATQRIVQEEGEKKHARLALADPHGPGRFWYVVPFGLNVRDILPTWAGLIEVRSYNESTVWMTMEEVVKAPRLHGEKVDPEMLKRLYKTCYWRYHTLLSKSKGMIEVSAEENAGAAGQGAGGNPLAEPSTGGT